MIALFFGLGFGEEVRSQDCFAVNMSASKIILSPMPVMELPENGDTLMLPCSKMVTNFAVVIQFNLNSETYFENTGQLVATLSHKGVTYILAYDKSTNTFSLPVTPPNLGSGNYLLTISALLCPPIGISCSNCTISYTFDIMFNPLTNLDVMIKTDPTPAFLTCFPGSSVTLVGTSPPNHNFAMQWSKLQNNQFVKITGATEDTLNAIEAGTYQYMLSGPGGCTANNITTVSPPQQPKVEIQPAEQKLDSCTQTIQGLIVANAGGDSTNLKFLWTASDNGVIKSGEKTRRPVISAPGKYTVVITRKDNNCTASATVTVLMGNLPTVKVDIARTPDPGHLNCKITEMQLKAAAILSNDSTGFSYKWSTGVKGTDIVVNAPGIYSVTATDNLHGCQGSVSATITQDSSKPDIIIRSSKDFLCAGEQITLSTEISRPGVYLWENGSGNPEINVSPPLDGPNTYWVTITAVDNGCTNTASKTVNRLPVPMVTCSDQTFSVENGGQLSLDCNAGLDDLKWITTVQNVSGIPALGTGLVQNQQYTLVQSNAAGAVHYFFYGENAGCIGDRVEVMVQVLPYAEDGIFIPELITPNGDGQNDNWNIKIPDSMTNPESYKIVLFSRNGAKVYEGDLSMSFHASSYPDGTYYYVVLKPDGKKIRGGVTIFRKN